MCHRDIYVQYLCKRIVPNSVVDHGLRDPVSEGWHVSLTEFKGVVDGEVHREGENKDPTVSSRRSSTHNARLLEASGIGSLLPKAPVSD